MTEAERSLAERIDCPLVRLLSNGQYMALQPGRKRISLSNPNDKYGWVECWDYDDASRAERAMRTWRPGTDVEPYGWVRHLPSNRRRINGDPDTEHVRP